MIDSRALNSVPKRPTPRIVAVTGANGFIGSHVIKQGLEAGWEVRALVRPPLDPARTHHLRALPGADERLTIVAGDVLDRGSLITPLLGCDAVVHSAASVKLTAPNPQADIVDIAVLGTRNAFEVAEDVGVTRFVLTSSESAIVRFDKPNDYVFTERDWSDDATLLQNPYGRAKHDSERLMWTLAEQAKRVEAVALLPGLVLGPVMCRRHLDSSISVLLDVLGRELPGLPPVWHNVTGVDIVAAAHVAAVERDDVVGQRFPIVQEGMWWREIATRLSERFVVHQRELPPFVVRLGTWFDSRVNWSVVRPLMKRSFRLDGARSIGALGLQPRKVDDILFEAAESLIASGFAPRAKRRLFASLANQPQ
jgi:nucleoside-diphosphate-sugar epimerase